MKRPLEFFVVDDDPTTNHENWPSRRSIRAMRAPRCPAGHFVKKSDIKTHYPTWSGGHLWWTITCRACGVDHDVHT